MTRLSTLAVSLLLATQSLSHEAAAQTVVVRAVYEGDLRILDPTSTGAYVTRNFANLVYDQLVAKDSKGANKPQMLESWETSADGMEYTFRLRDGLAFHDGARVTAEDCVQSVKRWGARDTVGRLLFSNVDSVVATGENTFVMKLARPFAHLIQSMAKGVYVFPARFASQDVNKPITEAIGSGPFVMKKDEWVPGDRVVLTANTNYKPRTEPPDGTAGGKVVKIDRLEMRFINDQATRIAALKRGEVDFVLYPSMDYLPSIKADKSMVVDGMNGKLSKIGWVALNHEQPPFDNPLVRRAFQYAIDSEEIMSALGFPPEFSNPGCRSIYSCGTGLPHAPDNGGAEYSKQNIEKAKALLKQAGYKGEKIVSLHTTNIRTIEVPATLIEEQLRKVGFNVESQAVEWNTVMAKSQSKDPIEKGGWSFYVQHLDSPDLQQPITHPYVVSNCSGKLAGWTCDETAKALFQTYLLERDPEKSAALARSIEDRFMDNGDAVIWGQFIIPMFYRSYLNGMMPSGLPTFWNVTKTAR